MKHIGEFRGGAGWRLRRDADFARGFPRRILRRGEGACLGVDIGSQRIKVVETTGDAAALRITAAAMVASPAGAVRGNVLAEPERVGARVGECVEAVGARTRLAAVSIPGSAVMAIRLELPPLAAPALADRVLVEAGRRLPDGLEEVNLDFRLLSGAPGGRAAGKLDVMLVAARKGIVRGYDAALRSAGLTPIAADVDFFAIERVFEIDPGPATNEVVALVDAGARHTAFGIVAGGIPCCVGDVPAGVGPDEAPALWAEEVGRALILYGTGAGVERVHRVRLSGGAARTAGVAEALAARLHAVVDVADPFARVAVAAGVDAEHLREQAPAFAIAVGMAMRRPGDSRRG